MEPNTKLYPQFKGPYSNPKWWVYNLKKINEMRFQKRHWSMTSWPTHEARGWQLVTQSPDKWGTFLSLEGESLSIANLEDSAKNRFPVAGKLPRQKVPFKWFEQASFSLSLFWSRTSLSLNNEIRTLWASFVGWILSILHSLPHF